ncbi:DNA (cytosine-5)-methyltransferase 1 [Paenibacillus turicensis]|uniref:Cytosine-specific methyltransferase n=1 Tax=Paenibacillus turicensis TaxID=160487 RepID=A0ABS4FMQ2_9BACL|nr:DNA cytosine methyltransferase [Paenibacillus turicensis]MBP1903865.1 DNA (cytosine-5)-methyltransferase 1 [Paenibacillus turicensis]
MEKYKVLDLFAGAGGLSLGFHQTGRFETVMAVEINENAARTYARNHRIEVNTQDIKNIDFKNYKKYPKLKDVSLIIGGPPCQGFSNANRQKSELFSNNNLLVKEFVRSIKEIQPVAFVMENVKAISSDKHKFFVTNGELEDIASIGVQIKEEDIFIGNTDFFNEQLINLFNEKKILSPFADNKIITKLKSLIRYTNKHKDVKDFIDKNSNFFNRYLPDWNQHFNNYDYKELRDLIRNFKISLEYKKKYKEFNSNLIAQAKQIIEIHNITLIFKEIIEKKIEYSTTFIKKDKGIFIKGFTFTVIDYLLKTFESLGYLLDYGVLNSAQYGVPQERNRYFIIGHLNSQPSLPSSILSEDDFFTIGYAIEDLEELHPSFSASDDTQIRKNKWLDHPLSNYLNAGVEFLSNHVVTQSTKTALKRFKSLTPGQNFHDLDDSLKSTYTDTKRTQNTIYKRLDYTDVCNTVVNVRKSMWIHPRKNRAISIREAARLQSFPDDYIFTGTKDSQYQQIGNAVPPLLGRAVAEQLLYSLNDKPHRTLADLFNKEKEAVH